MTPWVVGLVGTIQASCAVICELCWQHKFLSGIPIWAAHYSYKSGGHKQCIGLAWPGLPVNVRSIWSRARPGHWEPPTDFIVSNWNMQRRNEYISYHSPHSLSPSIQSDVSVSYLLLFLGLQTSKSERLHFLLMWEQWCEQLGNYQAVNSVSEQAQFATNTWDNQVLAKSAAAALVQSPVK